MLTSEPLYYAQPYDKRGSATVIEVVSWQGHDALILDKTLFYPEGGGQPGDRGTIGTLPVIDTQSDEHDRIIHVLGCPNSIPPGMQVDIELDWTHRYDFMQQHTAQHLLSGTMHALLGIGTVSVHLGADDMSIEVDVEEILAQDIVRLEDAANEIVASSVPVSARTVSQEESKLLGLRRPVKVDGDVRIVTIGTFDTIACGGVHVSNTKELRYIQYVRSERIRGRLRTFWVAGDRSVGLIRTNKEVVDLAGALLSSPPQEIAGSIGRLQKQLGDCQYQHQAAIVRIASLLLQKELGEGPLPTAIFDASAWQEEEFKGLAEALLPLDAIALCAIREREDGKIAWIVAIKGHAESARIFQLVRNEALPIIAGKGGGKPPLWQGIGTAGEGKAEFLDTVSSLFSRELHDQQG